MLAGAYQVLTFEVIQALPLVFLLGNHLTNLVQAMVLTRRMFLTFTS